MFGIGLSADFIAFASAGLFASLICLDDSNHSGECVHNSYVSGRSGSLVILLAALTNLWNNNCESILTVSSSILNAICHS